jgi:hypothetical protein
MVDAMAKYIGWCVIVLETIGPCNAQAIPTPQEFASQLQTCSVDQRVDLSQDMIRSITGLYSGENSRLIFRNVDEFIRIIPEADRIEAYRLYADCLTVILPQLTSKMTGTSDIPLQSNPPPVTTVYRVCSGEYERACQEHNVYLYCNESTDTWAQNRCTTSSIKRLNSYGGNKCGYSIDEVICVGPK